MNPCIAMQAVSFLWQCFATAENLPHKNKHDKALHLTPITPFREWPCQDNTTHKRDDLIAVRSQPLVIGSQ
jgi:hypothetical protein